MINRCSSIHGDSMCNDRFGDYVDYEDHIAVVAELEARCTALAAENAWIKVTAILLADEATKIYKRWNLIQQPDGDIVDMQTIQEMMCACHETPATDAFLAEVRAQGVERYADKLTSDADDAERNGFDDAVKFLRSEAQGVREFAAQLRQEAK